jgi:outer membrane protein
VYASRSSRALLVATALWLGGCALHPAFWRPDGDGGWDADRRRAELDHIASGAGVDFAPVSPTRAPAPRTIDLAAALEMAAKGNRRIAESEHDVSAFAQRVRSTRGRLLPNAAGAGRYTWFTDSQSNRVKFTATPGNVGEGSGATAIEVRPAELGVLNGTLTVPLDLSGELRHALAAAQAGYRGEQARLWATTLEQQLGVVQAYFGVLEAKRLREVTEQNAALYREQLANAESRFANGRLTKNQLLVVQVALRDSEVELERRDLEIARARRALNQGIGADVDAATEPVDVREGPAVPAIAAALRSAYQGNPLLRSLLEEQQRLEETEISLERQSLPRFFAGGAVDYSSSNLLEPQDFGSGFVGFSWDLDLDRRRAAELAEARIAAQRNRIEIERQLRELESAVRLAQQSATERLAALRAAETAVGQAEENVRIRRQQFDAGRASSEDVLDAQALLSAQRASRARALYQAHVRLAELRDLMGMAPADGAEASSAR